MKRWIVASLFWATIAHAQVAPGEQPSPSGDPDPAAPTPAPTPDVPTEDAPKTEPPLTEPVPPLEPAPPPRTPPAPPPAAPFAADDATTSAAWRPGYHFDLHWRLLMLPERVIELVFLPISLVVSAVEEYRLDNRLDDLFDIYGGRIKLSPRFKFSLGDGAGAGLWIRRSQLFARRAELRLGGIVRLDADWQVELEYKHALLLPGGRGLRTRAFIEDDKNQRFYGIGGSTELEDRRVLRSFEQGALVEIDLQGVDRFTYAGTARVGFRRQELSPGTSTTYAPVGEPGDPVMPPPTFGETALYADARIEGRYDTRDTFARPTRGALINLAALGRREVTGLGLSGITLSGSARWHLPVMRDRRVVLLTIAGAAAMPMIPGETIPLDSLAVIGRSNVRGYDRERFRDRYALVGSIEYRFPIYEYLNSKAGLDAFTFVDSGTIWGASKFDVKPLWSVGGGVRGAHDTALVFETTLGYSPEGFEFSIGAEQTL